MEYIEKTQISQSIVLPYLLEGYYDADGNENKNKDAFKATYQYIGDYSSQENYSKIVYGTLVNVHSTFGIELLSKSYIHFPYVLIEGGQKGTATREYTNDILTSEWYVPYRNAYTNLQIFYTNEMTFARIYDFELHGVHNAHLIPCYRKSDNKPGMYDVINDIFYTNSQGPNFAIGKEINNYN